MSNEVLCVSRGGGRRGVDSCILCIFSYILCISLYISFWPEGSRRPHKPINQSITSKREGNAFALIYTHLKRSACSRSRGMACLVRRSSRRLSKLAGYVHLIRFHCGHAPSISDGTSFPFVTKRIHCSNFGTMTDNGLKEVSLQKSSNPRGGIRV